MTSAGAPSRSSSAAVPIQIGLVRFGGISVNVELPDSGYKEMIAIGMLYPSTREIS